MLATIVTDFVVFRRGAFARRLLLLVAVLLGLALMAPRWTRAETPILNDGHALTALELAFTRTFCGTGSYFPAQYRVPHHVRDHPDTRFIPLRQVALDLAGSMEQYCLATNIPFINNENSLTTVMYWLLWADPEMSLAELGTRLHRIRLAVLGVFAAVAVWAGLSVGAAALLVLLALDGINTISDLNYSLYPFLAPMVLGAVAFYAASMRWLIGGRWWSLGLITFAGGMLAAFVANLRTSYLPVMLMMLVVAVLAAVWRWRLYLRMRWSTCAVRVVVAAVAFAAGYEALQYGTITRHLRPDLVAAAPHHTIAHPLVLSLAVPESELSRREGIEWLDGAALPLAQKMLPDATYMGPTYDQALFMYYRHLWRNHTGEMLDLYRRKFAMAGIQAIESVRDNDGLDGLFVRALLWPLSLLPSGLWLLLACGAFLAGGLWLAVRRASPFALMTALLSSSAGLLLVESAIIMPRYTPTYHAYIVWYFEFISVLGFQGIAMLAWRRVFATDEAGARKTALYFDAISDDFGERMNPFDLGARLEWFEGEFERLRLTGARVLDVGAGLGQFSEAARARGARVVPLDIAPRLVQRMHVSFPAALCGSATQLPFPPATFDIVISSECIEHTPDPEAAIGEMLRVLRPEGMLLITTPNLVWRWSIAVAEAAGIRNFEGIENWLSRRRLQRVLEQHGGAVTGTAGLHILPFQLRFLHPVIRFMNRNGQWARAAMINQCWVARRLPSAAE